MNPIVTAAEYSTAALLFLAILIAGLFAVFLACGWVFDRIERGRR